MVTTGPVRRRAPERAVEAGVAHGVDAAVGRGQPVALARGRGRGVGAPWATTTEFSGTVSAAGTVGGAVGEDPAPGVGVGRRPAPGRPSRPRPVVGTVPTRRGATSGTTATPRATRSARVHRMDSHRRHRDAVGDRGDRAVSAWRRGAGRTPGGRALGPVRRRPPPAADTPSEPGICSPHGRTADDHLRRRPRRRARRRLDEPHAGQVQGRRPAHRPQGRCPTSPSSAASSPSTRAAAAPRPTGGSTRSCSGRCCGSTRRSACPATRSP